MNPRWGVGLATIVTVVVVGCSPGVDLTKDERAEGSACASDPAVPVVMGSDQAPFTRVSDTWTVPDAQGFLSVSSDGDTLWALARGETVDDNALVALDGEGNALTEWPVSGWPWKVHITDGSAVTMNLRNNTPMRIDLATGAQVSARGVGGDPQDMEVSADGRRVFQPLVLETAISVTDLESGEQVCLIPVVSGTRAGLAVSRDGTRLFIGYGGGGGSSYHAGVEMLDRATGETLALLPLGTQVSALELSPDESLLAGIVGVGRELLIVDPTSLTEIGRVELAGEGNGIAWHDRYAYVWSYPESAIWVVDADAEDVVATINLPTRPQDLTFNADHGFVAGEQVYVLDR